MNARGQDGNSMPVNQVVKEAMTIIVVGHEATASTLNIDLVSALPKPGSRDAAPGRACAG